MVVVDNSGLRRAHALLPPGSSARVIENGSNVGFGAAINQGIELSQSDFVATLNDDAVAHAGWIEALLKRLRAGLMSGCMLRKFVYRTPTDSTRQAC